MRGNDKAVGETPEINEFKVIHSLGQCLSALAGGRGRGSRGKTHGCLDPVPRGSDVVSLGCGLGIGMFQTSPDVCDVQPRVRATQLT